MRLTALLASLAFVALAFAGCSDGGDDDDGTTTTTTTSTSRSVTTSSSSSSTTSSSSSSSSTTTTAAPANQAPSGSVSAAVNGTNVTFTLTGSDPDGDTVTWELELGDGTTEDGTTLPATVEHAYAAGNYTVNFTITDGTDPVTYALEVPVVAGGGAAGIVFIQAQAVPSNPASSATVETPLGNIFLGAAACAGFYAGENGQDCVWFELDLAFEGRGFTITSDAGDPDYEFWHACDPTNPVDVYAFAGSTADGPEAGTIPAEAGCVVIWTKLPPDAPTHTFTVL
jgi:hypothetical protein